LHSFSAAFLWFYSQFSDRDDPVIFCHLTQAVREGIRLTLVVAKG
jgi:hypothetical protein